MSKDISSVTDQWLSRYDHISTISISWHWILDRIYLIGFDWTFFFIAQIPKVTLVFELGLNLRLDGFSC